jgi:Ca2+-binding RTX toxin-like protein
VPGEGDMRYTRYPDGTEELYHLGNDPNEHVNRLDFDTGKGLTPADDRRHGIMSALMDEQLENAGMLFSDGSGTVVGSAARELLVAPAGPGQHRLSGGGGGDTYVLYRNATVTELAGGGFDSVVIENPALETTFVLPANVEMVQVLSSFTGNAFNNIIVGSDGSGTLNGGGGNDTIGAGDGNDTLDGGSGNDRLSGAVGRDVLIGGAGSDALFGGFARDIFRFRSASDSTPTASDTINGFEAAGAKLVDRIDLSAIDANVQISGNQAFAFGGTTIGRVRVEASGSSSVVLANTDGDSAAEVRIVIKDGGTLPGAYTADDIIL